MSATQLRQSGLDSIIDVRHPYEQNIDHLLDGLRLLELRIRYAIQLSRHQAGPSQSQGKAYGLYITDGMVDQILDRQPGQAWWWRNEVENEIGPSEIGMFYNQWFEKTRLPTSPAIDLKLFRLAERFELTQIEVDILLLTVAPEIDLRFEQLFGFLNDDVTQRRATIDLILTLLLPSYVEQNRYSAIFDGDSPLVKWGLIEVDAVVNQRPVALRRRTVRPGQGVTQFLTGQPYLSGCRAYGDGLKRIDLTGFTPAPWFPQALWDQLETASIHNPILNFIGGYGMGQIEAASRLAIASGQALFHLDLDLFEGAKAELPQIIAAAIRDSLFYDALLYLTGWDKLLVDYRPPEQIVHLLYTTDCPIILSNEKLWQVRSTSQGGRPLFFVEFPKFGYKERLSVWSHCVDEQMDQLDLPALANHFQFSPGQIQDAVAAAHNIAKWENRPLATEHLLEASRAHSNQNLSELAQKVTVRAGWEDLILPDDPLTQLRELTNQARNRPTVHDAWGFGAKLAGRGISALFTGEPGTGKTMSAGIIARDLGLDLYKVDLSSLVSKYIGETEKNLDRVFTEANTSNAVLFFDEADSIFGKRSEVKDSHDRYANLEISYLLQRVESYDGIAILATNMRANLDEAFTRRFDFITDFPFPDPTYREMIWRIHFPPNTPVGDDIDFPLLAQRFRLAGGNIRKIVLSAAFLAAQAESPIDMAHVLHAVKREYQKMGRLIEDELFQ